MTLQLLELDQADQLSACKLSLLLGIFEPHNQVESCLRFARRILRSKNAILTFKAEPYIWYLSSKGMRLFHSHPDADLGPYFNSQPYIDQQHSDYHGFCQHIRHLGVEHQRMVAFDMLKTDKESIGQILFFDDSSEPFENEDIEIVKDYCERLVRYLELKFEHAELKELYEQQSALNFSKTKFFQIIAHDLRAPFHGLLGFSEVLSQERNTLDDSSIQNIADYLYDTAQSTYNLLESLLNWAMAEGGRFVYHPINFNLKQVTKIVRDVLNTLAIKKNIQLIDEVPDDLKVYADINMLTSIIQNLVSNALKFTPMDGTGKVTIQAQPGPDGVEIYIRDTGLGMSEAQIANIFQPRITVSLKGTAGEKGTGLGLTLCKRFVDLNKGEICVMSKEGEGTTFKVTLPEATDQHTVLPLDMAKSDSTTNLV
ncbi:MULTISPECIES: sensor histidine kinase [Acinetobacter]|jgi:signal transduction histidine kinase|uniref:histidine kinase n=1 Tax=Acinetobacter radioresistens TaxID=40216 RepID=A0A8H2K132_ACIRA|nr:MULTISPECIES: HAMP domain-containing sensor histidine kinase [Acinetobacter]ENV91006.1 hypothetical protein F939_00359 [Acinetobacter radioresistens DSM 6976 = NBRC 102413 = CIP 103788]EXB73147.1 his Kinase A domain protein [Acinetobacter sp. 230853]EXC33279.1 his Kinase A domain protein [Acinetobacter sp. 869535]MCK4092564.1 HAMP domain-containing histidine kinase [Acinetobacter radioresistens]MCU4516236.1 HAMP domain-containing histidine kinase [Acinetobacter radioresistens]